MQSQIYKDMVERVLGHEGGYVNDPRDPGGETNWGISKRSYPHLDIKALTRPHAVQIYYDDFWVRVSGDTLLDGVAYQMFDAAVNHGIGNAVRMAQRAAGVADDGHMGPVSLQAMQRLSESDFVMLFNAERIDYYTKLSTFVTYGKGWVRRVATNLRYGARDA